MKTIKLLSACFFLLTLTAFTWHKFQTRKIIVITYVADTGTDGMSWEVFDCVFNELPYDGVAYSAQSKIEAEQKKKYPAKKLGFDHITNQTDFAKKYVVILWSWNKHFKTGKYVKEFSGKIGLNRKEAYEDALARLKNLCGQQMKPNVVVDKQY